jgi:hypothetical protein
MGKKIVEAVEIAYLHSRPRHVVRYHRRSDDYVAMCGRSIPEHKPWHIRTHLSSPVSVSCEKCTERPYCG